MRQVKDCNKKSIFFREIDFFLRLFLIFGEGQNNSASKVLCINLRLGLCPATSLIKSKLDKLRTRFPEYYKQAVPFS